MTIILYHICWKIILFVAFSLSRKGLFGGLCQHRDNHLERDTKGLLCLVLYHSTKGVSWSVGRGQVSETIPVLGCTWGMSKGVGGKGVVFYQQKRVQSLNILTLLIKTHHHPGTVSANMFGRNRQRVGNRDFIQNERNVSHHRNPPPAFEVVFVRPWGFIPVQCQL